MSNTKDAAIDQQNNQTLHMEVFLDSFHKNAVINGYDNFQIIPKDDGNVHVGFCFKRHGELVFAGQEFSLPKHHIVTESNSIFQHFEKQYKEMLQQGCEPASQREMLIGRVLS